MFVSFGTPSPILLPKPPEKLTNTSGSTILCDQSTNIASIAATHWRPSPTTVKSHEWSMWRSWRTTPRVTLKYRQFLYTGRSVTSARLFPISYCPSPPTTHPTSRVGLGSFKKPRIILFSSNLTTWTSSWPGETRLRSLWLTSTFHWSVVFSRSIVSRVSIYEFPGYSFSQKPLPDSKLWNESQTLWHVSIIISYILSILSIATFILTDIAPSFWNVDADPLWML